MLNWREVPFFRILLPFVLGIGCYLFLDRALLFSNYLLIFLVAYLVYASLIKIKFQWRWINGLLTNLFFFLLAYQISFYHNELNDASHFKNFLESENLIIGTVENAPAHTDRSIQINLKTEHIGKDFKSLQDCSGTVMFRLRNDTIGQEIGYGDLLAIKAPVKRVRPSMNPSAFDFKKYLQHKNIYYQGFLKPDQWQKLGSGYENPVLDWAFNTRFELIDIIKENIKSENEIAVASALILGYKDELSEELKNAYSSTGAMHVLAVSGLHAGLIWGIIAFLLKWIRWKHPAWVWLKTGLTISGLWLFALITGASPSVLRAATMFSFLLIGMALNRNTNIYNTLAASAFCLLLFNPYLIVEVGFQLSYLAVIGIVYFYQKIYSLWYIENRVGDYLWKLTSVAIAAQLSTFPLSLFYFHQFPIYFWLSGMIVVPFAFLILGTGLSLFLFNYTIPFLNPLISKLLFGLIWLMNAMMFLIEQLPSGVFKSVWINWQTMLMLFLIIISLTISIQLKKAKYLIAALFLLMVISLMSLINSNETSHQRMMVVYHLSGKSYLEFVSGNQAVSFGDHEINEKNIKFATQNFHMKQKIKQVERFHFGNEAIEKGNWFLQKESIQFYDKKIVYVDKLPAGPIDQKIKVDYVLFRKWSKIRIEELNRFFEYEKIIFDGALSQWRILELKKQCMEQEVNWYDVNQNGALIIEID